VAQSGQDRVEVGALLSGAPGSTLT